ncbi:CBS domain-containing protein [Thiohalorhabdus methylotrophus]|uniref:CBS domain-containing protein n=1 Tax=Thiohalorhabdus methylotrophus TaxID=3242694 RepID=A0ABV4TXS3_9GAMM
MSAETRSVMPPQGIGEYCKREVVITRRERTIRDAARLMRNHHVGDLVVVEEYEGETIPVGMITDRDLVVEVLAEEVGMDEVTVGDVMSAEPALAREEDDLWETLMRMQSWGVRRLPVVDAAGVLQGIITVDDLLELCTEYLHDLVKVVTREQERELARRGAR